MEGLDYWRLCDELSVIQAALLVVGEDPSVTQESVDSWSPENRPKGYDAAKAALTNAVISKRLSARVVQLYDEDGRILGTDWHGTTIEVRLLREWLMSRGIGTGFFFPKPVAGPDYLNPFHPSYSPKLAAAVTSWKAISADPSLRNGKSVKQALIIWLRQHANDFELSKADGHPNEQGIEEIAKIANWDLKGGAPKTPDHSDPPIPF